VYVITPEKTVQLRRVKLGDIEGDKAVILENYPQMTWWR
jgi:hypothetical protein